MDEISIQQSGIPVGYGGIIRGYLYRCLLLKPTDEEQKLRKQVNEEVDQLMTR